MPTSREIDDAFERAVTKVDVAAAAGMLTLSGASAAPSLARLRADLLAQRDLARAAGHVDAEWIRRVIRSVAEWTPDTDITLIAALGALARLRAAPPRD